MRRSPHHVSGLTQGLNNSELGREVNPNTNAGIYVPPHLRHAPARRPQPRNESWDAWPALATPAHDTAEDDTQFIDIPVLVTGNDCPRPIESLTEHGLLDPLVLRNLARCGGVRPSLLQKYAIPIVATGRDVLAIAALFDLRNLMTFLVPIISQLHQHPLQREVEKGCLPQAVIVTKNREVAWQILAEVRKLTDGGPLCSAVIFGGTDIHSQLRELGGGVDILVAAPGRLMDFLERRRVSLRGARFLVLMDVDSLLTCGFEDYLRRFCNEETAAGQRRQTVMLTPVMPAAVRQLAADLLDGSSLVTVVVGALGPSPGCEVKHDVLLAEEQDKPKALVDLLHIHHTQQHGQQQEEPETGQRTLIFVRHSSRAGPLRDLLIRESLPVTVIENEAIVHSFQSGDTPILITTDVMIRGFKSNASLRPTHVISYDMPGDMDSDVHRIGRTVQGGPNKERLATAFVSDSDAAVMPDLVEILRECQQEVPEWLEQRASSTRARLRGSGHTQA
jgi:ATP-dependent RNA helicase DDX3X